MLYLSFLKTKIPHQILTKKINKRKKKPSFVLLLNPLSVPPSLPQTYGFSLPPCLIGANNILNTNVLVKNTKHSGTANLLYIRPKFHYKDDHNNYLYLLSICTWIFWWVLVF